MDPVKTIVVGVDFSRYSQSALTHAMRVAAWNAAKLRVAHVIEPSLATDLAEAYGAPGVNTWAGFRETAKERVAHMISAAQETLTQITQTGPLDVETQIDVLFGNPFAHLLCLARDVSADLVILGSNGSSDPAHGVGSLASKHLRRAPTRVMLVQQTSPEPFRRIVCCVDLTDACRHVIKHGIRLARQNEAALHMLHIYSQPGGIADLDATPPATIPKSQKELEHDLLRRLHEFLPPFGAKMDGLEVEIRPSRSEDTKASVVEFVKSVGADCVVIATRGRTELGPECPATTAEKIAQEASCSVLALKTEEFKCDVVGQARSG